MKHIWNTIWHKKSFLIVFSLFLSVLTWLAVVWSVSSDYEKTVTRVPVAINLPTTSDLNIVEGRESTVTVNISGLRYHIGNLGRDGIKLRANLSGVSRPGSYDLKVEVVPDVNAHYQVNSITPSTIRVTFDREISRDIPLEISLSGVSVPVEGYVLDEAMVEPRAVTVQGPEAEVERISKAVVTASFTEPLTESASVSVPIQFQDSYGRTITSKNSHISCNYEAATVVIPVKEVVDLPLTLSFLNIPDGFPIEQLSYQMSNEFISVAATKEVISRYYEIPVGYVDLRSLDLTERSTLSFTITLPEKMDNYANLETVIVAFRSQNLASKTLRVGNVTFRNVPPQYEVKALEYGLNKVKMIGDADVIESLSASDLVAEADLSGLDIQPGQYMVPVRISAPSRGFVWAIGEYRVVVTVKESGTSGAAVS